MLEKPFFFQNGNYRLFGVSHQPENKPVKGGFVFCHPFAEEKLWTHRVFVSFARLLADSGVAVLRFDYMGHGDSEGDFEDSTVATRLSDINCALDQLKIENPVLEKVGVLGMRFGGALAALVALQRKDVEKLVLWEPVINGSRYMMELLRSNLTTQLANFGKVILKRDELVEQMKSGKTVNVDGYELSFNLYEQSANINLLISESTFHGDVLIIQISKEGQSIRKELSDFANLFPNCDVQIVTEEPFWREIKRYYGKADNLYAATQAWLKDKI